MCRSTCLLMLEICFLAIEFSAVYAQKFKDIRYLKDMPKTSIDSLIQEKPTLYCDTKTNLYNVITKLNEKHAIFITWHRTKAGNWDTLEQYCSVENGLQAKQRCVYNHLTQLPNWEPFLEKELISCELSMYCKEEEFRHYFVQTDGQLKAFVNKWKPSVVGENAGLLKVCLKPNGVPLTRKCLYDKQNQSAHWESLSNLEGYKCLSETNQKIISKKLNDLHNDILTTGLLHKSIDERKAVANRVLNLLDQPNSQRLPADVFTTSEILKLMTTETRNMQLSTDVVKIVNNMMTSDAKVLRISADLNATNSILATFENYMDALSDNFVQQTQCENFNSSKIPANYTSADIKTINLAHLGVFIYFTSNISTFFINPLCANISGIALYPIEARITKAITYTIAAKNDSRSGIRYRFVYMNESIVELLKDSQLKLATFVPLKTMQPIQDELRLIGKKASIVLKIYSNDALFVETDTLRSRKPSSEVLSVSLPSYEGKLMQELPFILRINYFDMSAAKTSSPNCGCGYWNYKTWISNGVHTNNTPNFLNESELVLCYTNHLTQFTYLIGGTFRQSDYDNDVLVTVMQQRALDVVSLVGCALSFLGLIGVWITALVIPNWISQASNKILLNLCSILTLQMVFFLFVNTDDMSEALIRGEDIIKCIVLGALLQYTVLVLFLWMLIIAVLQFQRYVIVIGVTRPKNYIAKSAIIAWFTPLISTLLVVFLDPRSYIPSPFELAVHAGACHPSGSGLHYGVLLPISLIILINLTIFIYVLYSITRTLNLTSQANERGLVIKQIQKNTRIAWLDILCPARRRELNKKELQRMTTISMSNALEKSIVKSSISHSLERNMKVYQILFLIYLRYEVNGQKLCPVDHCEVSFRSLDDDITILIKWEEAKVGTTSVLKNVCSNFTGLPLERHCSYNRDTGEAEWLPYNKNESTVHCSLITNQCERHAFEHDFIMKGNILKPFENHWKNSYNPGLIGLETPCLRANGLPIARRCLYNPAENAIQWESIKHWPRISCYESSYSVINQQVVTNELSTLHREFVGNESLDANDSVLLVNEIARILKLPQHVLLPADIELTGKILQIVTQSSPEPSLMKAITNLTNTVMSSDSAVLSLSAEMNATNTCLKVFEDYVDKTATLIAEHRCDGVNNTKVQIEITENIGVLIVSPKCTNISGLAIYSSHISPQSAHYHSMHFDGLSNLYYRYLYLNQSVGDLLKEQHLLLASFVPEGMWNKMCNELWSHRDHGIVAIKVYKNDKLFVDTSPRADHKPNSLLVDDLPIIFSKRQLRDYPDIHIDCGYWNYSAWDTTGVRVVDSIDGQQLQDYVLCYSNHLTPFSYLVGGVFEQPNAKSVVLITLRHIKALDIISLIGCSASLIGLLCIWLTALIIKNWRSLGSNKVLLHLCAVLTLIIVTFIAINLNFVIEQLMANSTYCVIMGAFLQYIILVLFVWMLIIAILQYQRFVIVLGIVRPKYYITKSAIVAWSLPLIPTLYVALTTPESYVPTYEQWIGNSGICYPTGHGLHFGVLLPISIVVTINIGVILYIFYSLCRTRLSTPTQLHQKSGLVKEIRLMVLLFFLLGLSWIFGLLAYMNLTIVFSYLFCMTATLQGFMLFLYFIILDKHTRDSWTRMMDSSKKMEAKSKSKTSNVPNTASRSQ
uniref:G-protein coupled receptors family 2 profile 2 domain-containing protein n=1 Tax=Glossina pallidipes TaxID=7398 RepID=A0A1B0AJU9_GLOPL